MTQNKHCKTGRQLQFLLKEAVTIPINEQTVLNILAECFLIAHFTNGSRKYTDFQSLSPILVNTKIQLVLEAKLKGNNLLFDKISDPNLQREWHQYLALIRASIENLKNLRHSDIDNEMRDFNYFEAVLEFLDARDDERNYFWDTFIRPGSPDKKIGQPKEISDHKESEDTFKI